MNYKFKINYNDTTWDQHHYGQVDPFNQYLLSEYPDRPDPGYPIMNFSEFVQDNVYIDKCGRYVVRDESEYELRNTIIHPNNTRPGLVITPKRLARDPGGVIQRFQHGWLKNDSDQYVSLAHRGYNSKLWSRRRKKRD